MNNEILSWYKPKGILMLNKPGVVSVALKTLTCIKLLINKLNENWKLDAVIFFPSGREQP